jgi:alpha-1,2-mannosyltransferase
MSHTSASARSAAFVAAVAAVCALTASAVLAISSVPPQDLAVYRAAGYSIVHGISLYGASFPAELPLTYPPFAALPFVGLVPLPWPITLWLWTFGTLMLLGWVVDRSFDRLLPTGAWPRALAVSGLVIAFAVTSPLSDHLGYGQINVLLMAACLADLFGVRPRWLPAGVLIGLATAVKLVPALFVVYLLLTRRFRSALCATVTAAAATLAAFAVSPSDSRRYFFDLLWHLDTRVGLKNNATIGNQSLYGAWLRILPASEVRPAWLVSAAVVLVAGMWAARRAWAARGDLAGAAVTGLVAVLVSPVSWPHYLVWLVPAIAVLVGDGRRLGPLAAGIAVWLVIVCRTHRLGQDLVDAHPVGALRVAAEVLRSSYVLISLALVARLGALTTDRAPPDRAAGGAEPAPVFESLNTGLD